MSKDRFSFLAVVMAFWTYILHCRGGAFYTGHTDDLEHRLAQHKAGEGSQFTAERLPVELVWSGEFGSRQEAFEFERRVKGWSRAKKLALVRGDWDAVSKHAKSKSSPSTSSGRAEGHFFDTLGTAHPELVEGSHFSLQSTQTEITGTITAPARLDKALADATEFSRARVQALIAEGRVELNGKPAMSASAKVAEGAPFRITVPAAVEPEAKPQDIPLDVTFEDEHLIVINKPAGMVVHPAAGNPDGTLVNALLHHCGGSLSGIGGVARPGIVHRIDKDTSGLLVVAKSDTAHEGLAAQFAEHSVHRRYLAVCGGHPAPAKGTIDEKLGRSDANRKKMAVLTKNSSRGKHAITHYKILERLDSSSLIECRLETGRTHQVRVHCASIGHSLLGDQLYGKTPKSLKPLLSELNFARQALHAAELGFIHPISQEVIRFVADLPADMRELIDELSRSNR